MKAYSRERLLTMRVCRAETFLFGSAFSGLVSGWDDARKADAKFASWALDVYLASDSCHNAARDFGVNFQPIEEDYAAILDFVMEGGGE